MRCKWALNGRIKLKVLTYLGDRLKNLQPHRQNIWSDVQYRIIRSLLENFSSGKVYEIVSSASYSETCGARRVVLKEKRIGYAANVVIVGHDDKQELKECPLPDLTLTIFNNVKVANGSDLVLDTGRRFAINDYCAENKNENHGYEDAITYYQRDRIAFVKPQKEISKVDAGIRIDGRYSNNYYHNVYENLIRLLAIEDINDMISQDVPFIVDKKIIDIPSFHQIFNILSERLKRSYIVIEEGTGIEVGQLYSISAINFLVPIHLGNKKGGIEDYVFDRNFVLRMRERLLAYKSPGSFPKRIFLTRKSTTHRKINEAELFNILQPLGFDQIAPENYSFQEQMAIFNGAEWIVGSSGAAFTNLLFCSDNCTAICLDRYGYTYPVFTAPACFCGARLLNFHSDPETTNSSIHSDFIINAQKFEYFIKSIIS